MKMNREKVAALLNEYFDGSYTKFANELSIDTSHLHRFLNKGVGGGKKVYGAIMKFCREKGLDFEEYVDWD